MKIIAKIMENYRLFVWAMAIVSMSSIFACVKVEEREIKIGAILPLTGDLALYGQSAMEGIILMREQIDAKGEVNGKKITVIFEDSKASPELAISAMNKLIKTHKVVAIIGDVASSPTLAISPIANKNKIPVVSPFAASPDITYAGLYIFRVRPSAASEVSAMADYVKEARMGKVALLYVNNNYGRAVAKNFKNRVSSIVRIVAEKDFEPNTADMQTQLSEIKGVRPDAIYLVSYPKDTVLILRQYKEMDLKSRILTTSWFENPQILREAPEASEGVIYSAPIPPEESDPTVSAFKREYQKRFGKEPGPVSDYSYDALKVILKAVEICPKASGEKIKEGLEQIQDIPGATGLISFNEYGDVVKSAGIKTVENGKFIWLKQR